MVMVERSPYIQNVGQFLEELDQATEKLTEISQSKKEISQKELKELIAVLKDCNATFGTGFWDDKKLTTDTEEEIKASIKQALEAIQLFNTNRPDKNKAAQRNVEQAIVALFATLTSEVRDFDKNLKNLKDYKIGRKVEKSQQSKQS